MHWFNMSMLNILILLGIIPIATIQSYLDTRSINMLKINQILTSPLGYYRVQFISNCSLQILFFNQTSQQYENGDVISSNMSGQQECLSISLSIASQGLITNDGKILRKPVQNGQIYNRFVFGINDFGLVYIVSYWQQVIDHKLQYVVQYFQKINQIKNNNLFYNLSYSVNYNNLNGWNFRNANGLITISKSQFNITMAQSIDLRGCQFKQTGFVDKQGEGRYGTVPGMTFQPRAGVANPSFSPQGIFAQFDKFWPIMRVYDRDKYLVVLYSIGDVRVKPCPQKMFELNGQCNTSCPNNYYKEIRGKYGTCVLACEGGSVINQDSHTCYSSNDQTNQKYNINEIKNKGCPSKSVPYEYGCVCSEGLFFDFHHNICINSCPEKTYGINGICAKCPQHCKNCNADPFKLTYLSCSSCETGYDGSFCNISNTTCKKIQNCVSCQLNNGQQQCVKCNPFYALSFNQKFCSYNCFSDQVLAIGVTGQGYCQRIDPSKYGSSDSYISGYYLGVAYKLLKSGTCPQNMYIHMDNCITNCPQKTSPNSDSRCVCASGMSTFHNQTCISIESIEKYQLGYYYNDSYNSYLNCPIGCLKCSVNQCFKCSPHKYILVVSDISSVCRENNIHFVCNSQHYTYLSSNNQSNSNSSSKICISNNMLKSSNITNCLVEIRSRCIMCTSEFYLDYLWNCVENCGKGYIVSEGMCINYESFHMDNQNNNKSCEVFQLTSLSVTTVLDWNVLISPIYKTFSLNGREISNEPVTQIFSVRNELGIKSEISLTTTIYYPVFQCILFSANSSQNVCMDQTKPYQLLNKTCVSQCQKSVVVIHNNQIVCLPVSACYKQNNFKPYQLVNGTCVSECPKNAVPVQFGNGSIIQCIYQTKCQQNDTLTPFLFNSNDNKCVSSCQQGTSPVLQSPNNVLCSTDPSDPKPIQIDASVYVLQNNQKIYYFVVDKKLRIQDVKVNYYTSPILINILTSSSSQSSDTIHLSQFSDKSYISINTTSNVVILDFSSNIIQLSSIDNNRLSSSIYGITEYEDHIHNIKLWLAIISNILSIIFICLHGMYLRYQIIYKIDNWIIFMQILYFVSFSQVGIGNGIGQFYYGFFFAHLGFFPNYFRATIPANYMEGYAGEGKQFGINVPNSYKLLTGDANFIRNGGFSLSFLITFLFTYCITIVIILLLKKYYGYYKLWNKRIAISILIGVIELVTMNIFYWSIAHLLYNNGRLFNGSQYQPIDHVQFRISCSIVSIIWICLYGIYMVMRFGWDKIGGIYMIKRLVFAIIMASSASQIYNNNNYTIVYLILSQTIFMLLRFTLQLPHNIHQIGFIILEQLLMMIAFLTIYLWNNINFISMYVSGIIIIFGLLFVSDFVDVYLQSKDLVYVGSNGKSGRRGVEKGGRENGVLSGKAKRRRSGSEGEDYIIMQELVVNHENDTETQRKIKDSQK